MSSHNNNNRKYTWPIVSMRRERRYAGVGSGEINIDAPFDGFSFFLAMAMLFLLLGVLLLVFEVATWIGVLFLVASAILFLISLYAYLSHQEEKKIQEEIAKQKAEKQKAWREKRRMEKKKHKHR